MSSFVDSTFRLASRFRFMWLADWTRRNWGKFGTYIRIWVKQFVVLAGSVKIRLSRHGDVCQVLLDSKDISAPVKHPEKRNYVSFAASFKMICFSTNKSPLHFGWILCPKSIQTIWTRRGGRLGGITSSVQTPIRDDKPLSQELFASE